MKADQLLKHAKCSVCGNGIGTGQTLFFWVITVERHGLDLAAIQRHDGLGMMMGSHALARVMGPDEDLTKPVMKPSKLTICETCMLEKFPLLADLAIRMDGGNDD